ncbi:hypothetical protein SAMN04487761_11046 [Lachnospiraceae bacterium C7]|nr:hypothetical protein SAMN04487761_11046 [Lachnospiraceae bacterium C7]
MKKQKKTKFIDVKKVFVGFLLIFALLIVERNGIQYTTKSTREPILKTSQVRNKISIGNKECLYITDGTDKNCADLNEQFPHIFQDMRIPYETYDIAKSKMPDLSKYKIIVMNVKNYDDLGHDNVKAIFDWTANGGKLMQATPIFKTPVYEEFQEQLGIKSIAQSFYCLDSFKAKEGFMIGAQKTYPIEDAYESCMNVKLDDSAEVYATSGDGTAPVIWTKNLGEGKIVVCNFGYASKAYRGIISSAYSLLEDICVYPVINGSSFYLDDFPSPTPLGDGKYIRRDYQMDIATFYSTVWWPDLLKLAKEHGMVYTGLIIESYNDITHGKLPTNKDTSTYYYFGNKLLKEGGEIGVHGYNHQPLCLTNYAYKVEKYNKWENYAEMKKSIDIVKKFGKSLFPDSKFSTYVPPSNVLSKEGRKLLGEDKDINTIASTYFPGGDVYCQEFEIGKDGVIETPRIISSCILDDYMRFSAFSEMNFHYVNSHFMHPDDLLDVDRGADIGWKKLKGNFDNYLDWMNTSAPKLRQLTGTEMGGAVQRYCQISLNTTVTKDDVNIKVKGLEDSAYCFVRINNGDVSNIKGATLEKLTGNLYLMKVNKSKVTMKRMGAK